MTTTRPRFLTASHEAKVARVHMPAALDLGCARGLRDLWEAPARKLIMDCAQVTTFDSAGIGLLALLAEVSVSVRLINVSSSLSVVLDVTGLAGLIESCRAAAETEGR